jgi:hypothetical protein
LERLLQRLGKDTPYLGSGVSDARAVEIEREWNAGNIPVLLAHPASAGHGLNFQKGGAGHLCWFSVTLDYELYDQFLRRILRQGNTSARVVNHALVVPKTHDELSLDILEGKAVTQDGLLQALNAEVEGDTDMVRRVRRKSEVEETEEKTSKPKGWGGKASEEDEEDEDDEEEEEAPRRRSKKSRSAQKEKVRGRLKGEDDEEEDDADEEDEDEDEKPGFSRRVKSKLKGGDEEDEDDSDEEEAPAPKKPARRKKAASKPEPEAKEEDDGSDDGDGDEPPFEPNAVQRATAIGEPIGAAEFARERALHLTAQFAEQLGIRTASDAVKAAKVLETYLAGEK